MGLLAHPPQEEEVNKVVKSYVSMYFSPCIPLIYCLEEIHNRYSFINNPVMLNTSSIKRHIIKAFYLLQYTFSIWKNLKRCDRDGLWNFGVQTPIWSSKTEEYFWKLYFCFDKIKSSAIETESVSTDWVHDVMNLFWESP